MQIWNNLDFSKCTIPLYITTVSYASPPVQKLHHCGVIIQAYLSRNTSYGGAAPIWVSHFPW